MMTVNVMVIVADNDIGLPPHQFKESINFQSHNIIFNHGLASTENIQTILYLICTFLFSACVQTFQTL